MKAARICLASFAPALALAATPVAALPPLECRTTASVYFELEKAQLLQQANAILDILAEQVARCPHPTIIVVGHMDGAEAEADTALDVERTNLVAQRLRERLPGTPVLTQSLGFSNPALKTEVGVREPLNRRVEIYLR
jgi:OmpA-OmpF porin, OOP family